VKKVEKEKKSKAGTEDKRGNKGLLPYGRITKLLLF
jgi:hypothetical protein